MPFTYNIRNLEAWAKKLQKEKAELAQGWHEWRVAAEKAGYRFHLGGLLRPAPIVD